MQNRQVCSENFTILLRTIIVRYFVITFPVKIFKLKGNCPFHKCPFQINEFKWNVDIKVDRLHSGTFLLVIIKDTYGGFSETKRQIKNL